MIKKNTQNIKGFSLVEILVVLVIMAVLAAVALPALTGFIEESKGKSHTEEVRAIYTAAQAAVSEVYGTYDDYETISNQFYMDDGTKCGRVTNFAISRSQNNKNLNTMNEVDKKIAKAILVYIECDKKSEAKYVFNGNSGGVAENPLGKNATTFQKDNKQPGIVVAYNPNGKVVMVEWGVDGYLYEIRDGQMTITKDGNFHTYPDTKQQLKQNGIK